MANHRAVVEYLVAILTTTFYNKLCKLLRYALALQKKRGGYRTRTQNRVNRDLRSFQHENDFRINIKMVLALVGSSSLAEGGRSNIKDVTSA